METQLHVSQVQQPRATINRVHTLIHSTALLALFYYRFSSLLYQHINGCIPICLWLLISFSELLHSFLWVLGQASRWRPVSRKVFPERLPHDRELPPIDVFICTADPKKEPTTGVMNTVISAMCLDYPPEKLFAYVSDDGGAPITLYGMKEAYSFAKTWIPFCKKYGITTRAPEAYFSELNSEDKNGLSLSSEFIKDRNKMEQRYQEFTNRVEIKRRVDASLSSGGKDRPAVIEVIRDEDMAKVKENKANMPLLIYVSREKRSTHPHHFKAGALNALLRVSGVISNSPYILALDCDMYCSDPTTARQAMCFHMDPHISPSLAFVQFPQKFHNVSKNDIYNDLLRKGFEVMWYGVDGINGPYLSGTGFYMKREAFYRSPTQKDLSHTATTEYAGRSKQFIASLRPDYKYKAIENYENALDRLQQEAKLLASCTYEQQTQWGEQIGFIYHSVVEDYLTGLILQWKGWISVYCHSSKPSFLGSVTTNLNDTLIQTTRWNSGLLDVGFSRFCPLTYGSSTISFLQRMCYASFAYQPLSALPILCYAIIPQLCLLNGISLYPKVSDPWFAVFTIVYASWHFQHMLEVLATGGSLRLWWNHLRILMIKSVTAYFMGCLDILMKRFGMKEVNFETTSKVVVEEQVKRYQMDIFDFQAATGLLLPLATITVLNIASLVLGLRRAILETTYDTMFGQIFLSFFVVTLSYPIIEGMIIRTDKGRIPISVTILSATLFVTIISYGIFF